MKNKNKISKFKKSLRFSQTEAEHVLWYHLRDRRFGDLKFRRQHVLLGYIVDFVCLEKNLIIELDGGQHTTRQEYDAIRTRKLELEGFRVQRFWNNDVFENLENVLEAIYLACFAE